MTAATVPALAADLDGGLRRLKLAAMRRLAPELMVTAKTQRWTPEEFLRTLIDAEITSRDESNARTRMKAAAFPVVKTIDEFDVAASSIPQATFDYLASLEWIRAAENYCAVGPAGTGKSHSLIAFGVAAVEAGHKVRYFTAADLAETLYRGPGRQLRRPRHREPAPRRPGHHRRGRVRPARRHRRPAAVPLRRRRLRAPRPRHRLPLALRPVGPVPARAHHRRQPARPAPAPRHRRGHRRRVVPHAPGPNPREEARTQELRSTRGMETFFWPPAETRTWPLTHTRLIHNG